MRISDAIETRARGSDPRAMGFELTPPAHPPVTRVTYPRVIPHEHCLWSVLFKRAQNSPTARGGAQGGGAPRRDRERRWQRWDTLQHATLHPTRQQPTTQHCTTRRDASRRNTDTDTDTDTDTVTDTTPRCDATRGNVTQRVATQRSSAFGGAVVGEVAVRQGELHL